MAPRGNGLVEMNATPTHNSKTYTYDGKNHFARKSDFDLRITGYLFLFFKVRVQEEQIIENIKLQKIKTL